MAERPLILFANPKPADKARRYGGPSSFFKPPRSQQVIRLGPKFSQLQNAWDSKNISLTKNETGTEPEYTLVLEVAGDPRDFDKAVRKLDEDTQGVEWLFEVVDENVSNDDDFYVLKGDQRDDSKTMSFKYFCILTNHQALQQILSLWKNYKSDFNYKFPLGKTGLRNVFDALKDIHVWGVKERIEETGLLEVWEENLLFAENEFVKCEIEMFFRRDAKNRLISQQRIIDYINSIGGSIITTSCIESITYHAVLVSIPRVYAEKILKHEEVELLTLEQIMFFKPTGQSIVVGSSDSFELNGFIKDTPVALDEPIIAVFDGLPQEKHILLDNLLIVDDPDDLASAYQTADRIHGTSMASLIARGDLSENSEITARKIYVRPIMKPYPVLRGTQEYIPDDILIVDKIHEAVIRLFEPTAGQVASTVRIINLSIGIGDRLYFNMVSPLAKLLDWLSYKYHILFIVSAGNHPESIDLEMPYENYQALNSEEKNKSIIQILNKNSRNLRLLSPAESMNALTIGALFADKCDFNPVSRQLMPCTDILPSPTSSIGRGINRSIKPDILFYGGRSVLLQNMVNTSIAHWRDGTSTYPPGILSAKPTSVSGSTQAVGYSFGTSDAAALISHNAGSCYETLNEIFLSELEYETPYEYSALLIKAMLVHGARWGDAAKIICDGLGYAGRGADQVHKWIGYGIPDISRVKECAKNRITLIGYGDLAKDSACLYTLPLPFDFYRDRIYRSLTITLATFVPTCPTTQKYRAAQVWFNLEGKKLVPDRLNVDDKAPARGSLQHEIFTGDSAIVWDENDSLDIKINCRQDAGNFEGKIPYAIFVTFEIAPEHNVDVYQKVISKVKPKETITPIPHI